MLEWGRNKGAVPNGMEKGIIKKHIPPQVQTGPENRGLVKVIRKKCLILLFVALQNLVLLVRYDYRRLLLEFVLNLSDLYLLNSLYLHI